MKFLNLNVYTNFKPGIFIYIQSDTNIKVGANL